jgi:2-polyprenyl-6-methoxyphenol hydroxylase-like FAD-dependent oxidoreductase
MAALPPRADVLICGDGPAGMSLAIGLSEVGVTPLLLEKRTAASNTSRSGIVHARTLEVLAPYGIDADLLWEGIVVPKTIDSGLRYHHHDQT